MSSSSSVVSFRQPDAVDDPLTAVLRDGARRLLAQAVEAEAEAFLATMREVRLPDGRSRRRFHRQSRSTTCPNSPGHLSLCELNIDIICANSPQAKGRIERAFGTLQDRLVKELRLAGVTGVEAGNAWLPGFVADYNRRFGREPLVAKDLHRPLAAADDLDEVLAWREERTVTANLVVHYDRMMLLLDATPLARGLARKAVEVVNYPDERFAVRHGGLSLPFRVFDKLQTVEVGAVVENKRLSEVLAHVKARQAAFPDSKRRGAKGRARMVNNLEAPGAPSGVGPSATSTLRAS